MKKIEENKNYYLEWSSSELEIIFYPEKQWFGIIFLCIWLVGWVIGEIIAIDQLINVESLFSINFSSENENNSFLFIWVIFWTYGGIMLIISLLWEVSGEQKVFLNRENLTIEKRLGFISRKKVFEVEKVLDLRICQKEKNRKTNEVYRSSFFKNIGYLCFHYEEKKIRFGLDINRIEAQRVINNFKEISRFSNLKIEE